MALRNLLNENGELSILVPEDAKNLGKIMQVVREGREKTISHSGDKRFTLKQSKMSEKKGHIFIIHRTK